MEIDRLLWLIPALPLVGFVVNGVWGGRMSAPQVAAVGLVGPVCAFFLSVWATAEVVASGAVSQVLAPWFSTAGVHVEFGLHVDPLSAVMLLVVSGIGSLIHLYSYGYMHTDSGVGRFFAYLNLFMFSMLVLVLGDSLLMLFVGWEGVGLCSYLLIGFWYQDLANVDAGRKAFVVNRIGDLAFLLGVFILFGLGQTFAFSGLEAQLGHAADAVVKHGPLAGTAVSSLMQVAALCLFVGATGKSAQIPLYVWLPDAMAGPTPVSALIHAATMVTAGVYMMCRMDWLFIAAPDVLALVGVVAAATALLSGAIALAQDDIKKVLAYSTVSQLGFMFCGVAAGAFSSGLFHLVTHAFFKALLFLGAGAVIHALHGEQDIKKMGGLWKDLRVVAILFLTGSVALAGIPPLAGFWSKDAILGAVWLSATTTGGTWFLVFWMLVLCAGMTAFYTTRLCWYVFFAPEVVAHGGHHGPGHGHRHLHAPDWTMVLPLVVLAFLSLVGGALGSTLDTFVAPVVGGHGHVDHEVEHAAHQFAMVVSIAVASSGVLAGVVLYTRARGVLSGFTAGVGASLVAAARGKFFVDEFYAALIVRPTSFLALWLFAVVDRFLIDGWVVEGSGQATTAVGAVFRRAHTGVVNVAAASMAVGAILALFYGLVVGA